MSVTISINIQLDATDPAAFDAQLAAISHNLFGRAALSCAPVALPSSPPRTMPPTPVALSSRPPKRSAAIAPTADGLSGGPSGAKPPDGPETPRTPVLSPDTPAAPATPQIAAILPATDEMEPKAAKPPKQPRSGDRLPFDELDKLVAKELKRLSVDGRIPGAGLWDEQRDKRLPTYAAVMSRYGCTNLASFAEKMGMQPPLSKAFAVDHSAIYGKESEVA